jgi:uncharacterized membrane protein YhaH (DUF805 family)
MNLQTFTSFSGRISRMPFWLGLLILMIIQWVLFALFGGMAMMNLDPADPAAAEQMMSNMAPLWIITLIFLWPSLAIYTKRWHDRDKSGWWSLILFVPLIGFIWFLVECGFLRGTDGPNRFGEDPLAGT